MTVYFIRSVGGHGPVKIGEAGDIGRRLAALATSSPCARVDARPRDHAPDALASLRQRPRSLYAEQTDAAEPLLAGGCESR